MVTMANFVTGPFLDLFGASVYDHLKRAYGEVEDNIIIYIERLET